MLFPMSRKIQFFQHFCGLSDGEARLATSDLERQFEGFFGEMSVDIISTGYNLSTYTESGGLAKSSRERAVHTIHVVYEPKPGG